MIINVNTEKKYDIEIKKHLLEEIGPKLIRHFRPCKACIITDSNVHGLYTGKVETSLKTSGFEVHKIVFQPGENTKTFDNLTKILSYMAKEGFTSKDFIIALGGGVIGDLAGFSAAVYMRGINYVQMPTTLLASVDSSIGGKTAVNLPEGKNLAGAFWSPKGVYFDTACLESLSKAELQNGISEIIKSAVILDPHLFSIFENGKPCDLGVFIEDAIVRSINVKKRIVETDELEKGLRKTLNLGHTIGHAVEKLSDYRISHGRAVAMGLLAICRISEDRGWANENISQRLERIYKAFGFDIHIPYSGKELAKAAMADKKRKGDLISLVIPRDIGDCTVKDIHISQLADLFSIGISEGK